MSRTLNFASTISLAICILTSTSSSFAEDSPPVAVKELVSKVIMAAGGDEKLLTLFRMEERYNSGKEPWFFHEIVTIERLKELPEELKR